MRRRFRGPARQVLPGRRATVAMLLVLATACTSAPPAEDSTAQVSSTTTASISDEPSSDVPAATTIDDAPQADAVSLPDITALQTGTIQVVEEWTQDNERYRVTHDLAFDLQTGVVREQFDSTDLGEAMLAPVTEYGRASDAECSAEATAAGEEPGQSGCGFGLLESSLFALMLTRTDSFSIGDPRADDPGVVMTVGNFIDVMNNARSGLLSLDMPADEVDSWLGTYPPLEDPEASRTWGSLEPWADQVPFATYAADVPRALQDVSQLMTTPNTSVSPNGDVTILLQGPQTSKLFQTHLFDLESIDENVLIEVEDIEISIVVSPSVDESTLVPPLLVTRDELLEIADGA